MRKHEAFLQRLSADGFRPVPPLTCFDVKRYHTPTVADLAPVTRPCAAFQFLTSDASRVRAFNTARGARDVAAWVRNATAHVCANWPFGSTAGFVHGHDPSDPRKPLKGDAANARFAYLPLPSIERRGERGHHVGAIRRVLIAAPPGCGEQIAWIRRRLAGQELVNTNGEVCGILNLLPKSDWVLRQYMEAATTWATVTPVVLPGHDDHDLDKTIALLRRAFQHAGIAPEMLNHPDFDFDFRKVGFLPGVEHANRYALPEHPRVKGPRYHVWLRFPQPVLGPLAVGALRYRGFGVMVGRTE